MAIEYTNYVQFSCSIMAIVADPSFSLQRIRDISLFANSSVVINIGSVCACANR